MCSQGIASPRFHALYPPPPGTHPATSPVLRTLTPLVLCTVHIQVHERAEAVLGGSGAATAVRVPRGCLLRRVPLALPATPDAPVVGFEAALAAAGYRADRLSVWALQGLHGAGLTTVQLRELLAEVTNAAAFHSLVVGELPGVADRWVLLGWVAARPLEACVHESAVAAPCPVRECSMPYCSTPGAATLGNLSTACTVQARC